LSIIAGASSRQEREAARRRGLCLGPHVQEGSGRGERCLTLCPDGASAEGPAGRRMSGSSSSPAFLRPEGLRGTSRWGAGRFGLTRHLFGNCQFQASKFHLQGPRARSGSSAGSTAWVGRDPWSHLLQPPLRQGWWPQATGRWLWSIPAEGGSGPPWAVTAWWKVSPGAPRAPPVFQCMPTAPGPGTGHRWGSAHPSSSESPFRCLHTLVGFPLSLLFSRLNSPSSLSVSSQERRSSPFIIFVALRWTLSSLCSAGEPRTGHSPPGVASPALSRGDGSPLRPAGNTLTQPGIPFAGTAAARARCWLVFDLVGPPSPSLQSCFPAGRSPACAGTWSCSSPGAGLGTSSLWNCVRFPLAHLSRLLRSLGMAAGPPRLPATLPARLLSVQPALPPRSFMKTLNKPSVDPWGALFVTSAQLDFVSLIAAF